MQKERSLTTNILAAAQDTCGVELLYFPYVSLDGMHAAPVRILLEREDGLGHVTKGKETSTYVL